MRQLLLSALLLFTCAPAVCAGQPSAEAYSPITAGEAERRVADSRDFLTDMLWTKTEDYWHVGRWDEAIRLCRQIVQVDPHFVEAYTGAAYLLYSTDKDREAVELFRAGIAANPRNYDLPHEFGMYYMYRHKWDLAVEQFRKATELGAPRTMQHMLPNALERGGRLEEALAQWQRILKEYPDDAIAKRKIEQLKARARKAPHQRTEREPRWVS
ncbi:MAG: tetratricopeptide repeat protein [Armatimonadota bacterium]